jgi:uncharacterized protein YjaZ
MRVVNLTNNYTEAVLTKNNFDEYYKAYPVLFGHYFKYWSKQKNNVVKMTDSELENKVRIINKSLNKTALLFKKEKINLTDLLVVLFVGQNTTNGHAFFDGNRMVAWFPVEAYNTKKMADVFILHEIVHALHYQRRPEFYFKDQKEKNNTGRQLMTEGVATYISKQIGHLTQQDALWADYLVKRQYDEWLKQCEVRSLDLREIMLANWNSSDSIDLFMANDKNDITKFRAGYYLGLKAVQYIVKKHNLTIDKLLNTPREDLEKEFLRFLEIDKLLGRDIL